MVLRVMVFFPAENVLADAGHTIMNIDEGIETVKQRQPKNLFFRMESTIWD